MDDLIKEVEPKCKVCKDSGIIELTSGEIIRCHRGCPQAETYEHPTREAKGDK